MTGLMLAGGWHTCIRAVSLKLPSTKHCPALVTWWLSTKHSRNFPHLKIVVSLNGALKEVCSAKVRRLGEKVTLGGSSVAFTCSPT